jgi:hypothetical protein
VAADIGPYREYRQTGPHGLPLSYWVTPADSATSRPRDLATEPVVAHLVLDSRLGPAAQVRFSA